MERKRKNGGGIGDKEKGRESGEEWAKEKKNCESVKERMR